METEGLVGARGWRRWNWVGLALTLGRWTCLGLEGSGVCTGNVLHATERITPNGQVSVTVSSPQ